LKVEEFLQRFESDIKNYLIDVDFKKQWQAYTDMGIHKLEKKTKEDH
jgi:hypothetical protein